MPPFCWRNPSLDSALAESIPGLRPSDDAERAAGAIPRPNGVPYAVVRVSPCGDPTAFHTPLLARGFTLIELVMVMVLLGILAIVAIPRLNDAAFSEYGYFEETRSALRYARQVAIVGNAHVTVALSANGFRICRGDACPGNGYLTNPAKGLPWDGSATGQGQAPQGVSIATSLASITFNGLGRPSASGTLRIGSHTLTIEPETGYVH